MKIQALLISLALIVVGCGYEHDIDIDAELAPMLNRYLELAPNVGRLRDLSSLKFGDLPAGINGTCYADKNQALGVTYSSKLNIVIARQGSGIPRITTVFHELGHCLHGLRHTKGEFDIMNPHRSASAVYWAVNLETAVNDMFTLN